VAVAELRMMSEQSHAAAHGAPPSASPACEPRPVGTVAIVVLTHSRVHLLRQCVENVLARASERTTEIVIWDNASTDETRDYLDSLLDPRLRVIHHERNIGQNAYDAAFALTSAAYLIELDDDMIDAPAHWDEQLLDAFRRLPDVGFLSANLVDNPLDATARIMYGRNLRLYRLVERHGVRLKVGGPTGGGCSITSRTLYDRVGGFGQNEEFVFFHEDAAYADKVKRLGFEVAYLNDLEVFHAGGEHYAEIGPEKRRYYDLRDKRVRRKETVKRSLLRIPFLARLNERYEWFYPPGAEWSPAKRRTRPNRR
jgi:GT2 family glycosyltransferase